MVLVPVAGVAKASTAINALPPLNAHAGWTHRYIKRKSATLEKAETFAGGLKVALGLVRILREMSLLLLRRDASKANV
jgi:hypothetical protein